MPDALRRNGLPARRLMGLSDRCTGAIPRIDTLCRTIVAECVKRGFQGVLADFETNPYSDRLSFLSRLSAGECWRGMALDCPLSLPAEGAALSSARAFPAGRCARCWRKPPAAMARSVWRSTWNA